MSDEAFDYPDDGYDQCDACGERDEDTGHHECPRCGVWVCDKCSSGQATLCHDCEDAQP